MFFRVQDYDGRIKKIILAYSLKELLLKVKTKFEIEGCCLRTVDGFDIDDDDSFRYAAEENAVLIIHSPSSTVNIKAEQVIWPETKVDSQSGVALPSTTRAHSPFPIVYRPPKIPELQPVIDRIQSKDQCFLLGSTFRNRFLQSVFNDVLRYLDPDNPYIKSHQYQVIMDGLTAKYPLIVPRESQTFWRTRLIRRFKEYRSKLNLDSVNEKRKLYGRKKQLYFSNNLPSSSVRDSDLMMFPETHLNNTHSSTASTSSSNILTDTWASDVSNIDLYTSLQQPTDKSIDDLQLNFEVGNAFPAESKSDEISE